MRAALAATILAIASVASIGLAPAAPAHASVATVVQRVPGSMRLRMAAWHWALRQRLKPYIWGGTGPFGFDCS